MGVFRQSPDSFHSRQQLDHVAGLMARPPASDGKFQRLPRLDHLGSRGEGSGHNLTVDQDDVFPARLFYLAPAFHAQNPNSNPPRKVQSPDPGLPGRLEVG
jgi:hypothetical protein